MCPWDLRLGGRVGWRKGEGGMVGRRSGEATHLSWLVWLLPSLPGHLDLRIAVTGKQTTKAPRWNPKIESLNKNELKDMYALDEMFEASEKFISLSGGAYP